MSVRNDLGQWFNSIPPITRTWFTGSVIVPVAARLGLVRPQHLVLFVKPIFKNLQVYFFFVLFFQIKIFFIHRSGDYSHQYSFFLWALII
jgi:hypothetical protein